MFLTRSFYPRSNWRGMMSEMERMRREMDQLFRMGADMEPTMAGVHPLVNVSEDNDNFYVQAELPGMAASGIEISVEGKSLTLSGERKAAETPEGARFHRRERAFASFSRVIGFPTEIESEAVQAQAKDGVLSVTLPKAEKAKPRQIAVQAV
jgi:HSP20 family protein